MKTPWVGNINVAELIVLCLLRNLELSTDQVKLLSWVCGTLAGKFFLRLFFQGYSRWHWRGRWPSEFLCSLSIFFFVVLYFFLTFPLQTRNYWAQTKFQHHAQYPDNSAGSCSGYPAVSTLLGVLRKNIRQLYSMKKNIFQSVWTSASCRGCSVQCGEGTVVQCIVCMALCLRDNWPGKCKSHRSIYVYL